MGWTISKQTPTQKNRNKQTKPKKTPKQNTRNPKPMKTNNTIAPSTCGKREKQKDFNLMQHKAINMDVNVLDASAFHYRDSDILNAKYMDVVLCLITVMSKGLFNAFVSD